MSCECGDVLGLASKADTRTQPHDYHCQPSAELKLDLSRLEQHLNDAMNKHNDQMEQLLACHHVLGRLLGASASSPVPRIVEPVTPRASNDHAADFGPVDIVKHVALRGQQSESETVEIPDHLPSMSSARVEPVEPPGHACIREGSPHAKSDPLPRLLGSTRLCPNTPSLTGHPASPPANRTSSNKLPDVDENFAFEPELPEVEIRPSSIPCVGTDSTNATVSYNSAVSGDSEGGTGRRKQDSELIMRDVRHHWRKMIQKSKADHLLKAQLPLMRKSSKDHLKSQSMVGRCLRDGRCELLIMGIVVLNAAFIGWQVQHHAIQHRPLAGKQFGEVLFFLAFSLELLARLYTEGFQFFWSHDRAWNAFDFMVVSMMLLEIVFNRIVEESSKIRTLSLLRIVRLVRVIRVIRVLKKFRELRMMLMSVYSSCKSLTWAMLILIMMFYAFGIGITQGTIDLCEQSSTWASTETDMLLKYFGSLDRSVLSLFEAISGGISWGELVIALQPLPLVYTALFLLFISIAIFAVLNIVTGVFLDSALANSQADREALIDAEMLSKEKFMLSMQKVFMEMDIDNSGFISLEEFGEAIEDDRMVAYFNAVGLDLTDVKTLFILLDRDMTGSIGIEEFLLGILRLRGGARSLDLAELRYQNEWLVHNMEKLISVIQDLPTSLGSHTSTRLKPAKVCHTDSVHVKPQVAQCNLLG